MNRHQENISRIEALKRELSECEKELDYQVSHKRIAVLQKRIEEIEMEIENISNS